MKIDEDVDDEEFSDETDEHQMKIPFPFYTYMDKVYCEFMLKLMNSLEIRFYKKNVKIVSEMDECLEVLFVENGFYKVGYQINNIEFYRRRFGMFTVIGGFNILFDRRYYFMYKTSTDLKGLAIRKPIFRQLLWDYPEFSRELKNKFWKFFCTEIYIPLMKLKNSDLIENYQREDYSQILLLKNKEKGSFVNQCLRENMQ